MPAKVTVGVDIGTTSVKALAVDDQGGIVASQRVPHRILSPRPDWLEHDALSAWARGPRRAFSAVCDKACQAGGEIAAVCVAAMGPSMAAVDSKGRPLTPGILYGDARGRTSHTGPANADTVLVEPSAMPDASGFLQWAHSQAPHAAGYWPAQAVGTHALSGVAAIDSATSSTLGDLYSRGRWDPEVISSIGVRADQLPRVVMMGHSAGQIRGKETVVAGGALDALCDQIVSGASEVGDVLVICGATLVVWAVVDEWRESPGLWTVPHTEAGRILMGGPSNAGALFVDWARSLLKGVPSARPSAGGARAGLGSKPLSNLAPKLAAARDSEDQMRSGDPSRIPVWLPYLRGERVPHHDPDLRAGLFDLDITQGPQALQRAAFEASGFVVRHILDLAGVRARRIVASGGGARVGAWMAAMSDAARLPVHTVAVPEGAAYGAAYLARMAAGLETSLEGAGAWAKLGRVIEPDKAWSVAADGRYQRYRELADMMSQKP